MNMRKLNQLSLNHLKSNYLFNNNIFFFNNSLIYSNRKRVGTFLPFSEGSFFDHSNIIRNVSIVASSVSDPPVDGFF